MIWIQMPQARAQWLVFVNMVMNLPAVLKADNSHLLEYFLRSSSIRHKFLLEFIHAEKSWRMYRQTDKLHGEANTLL
jgi:hypothetical protein